MTVVADQIEITEPGVYDIPFDAYHAHPSLSSSGARRLLPPSCPALFAYEREHGRPPKKEFDLGHAAHLLVLGQGARLEHIEADNYQTKAAQQQRDRAYADGAIPLLPGQYEQVKAMAAALRNHRAARALFAPGTGLPEQSLFWTDRATGAPLRARLDWLRNPGPGRLIIPDYKTCTSAATEKVGKSLADFGYHQQAAWYEDAVLALGLADEAAFVLVCQEKTPPYLVNVVQPTPRATQLGRDLNRMAVQIYRQCTETGHWPGYSDDVELVPLPQWAENRALEVLA